MSMAPTRREWWGLLQLVAAVVAVCFLVLGAVQACDRQADDRFRVACERDHPGSHMSKTTHAGYKTVSMTRYCIGPNGELWDVQ